MIGRSWFVTEESLELHKANVLHDEIYRNRIENLKQKSSAPQKDSVVAPAVAAPESVSKTAKIKYSSDERPLLPTLAKSVNDSTVERMKGTLLPLILKLSSKPKGERSGSQTESSSAESAGKASPAAASLDRLSFLPQLSKTNFKSASSVSAPIGTASVATASIPKTAASDVVARPTTSISSSAGEGKTASQNVTDEMIQKSVPTYPELARKIILGRALTAAIAIALFVGVVATGLAVSEQLSVGIIARNFSADMYDAVVSTGDYLNHAFSPAIALFRGGRDIAVNIGENTENNIPPVSSLNSSGMVVAPSSGNMRSDQSMKEKIANSFSDQVDFAADKSGTAGVITPVFKEAKGKDFIYVMVPVKPKE